MKLKFDAVEKNPEFIELDRNYKARQDERAALRVERDKLADLMRKGFTDSTAVQDRIKAIAAGKVEPVAQSDDSKRLGELNKKVREFDDALEYLTRQKDRVISQHSAAVCESLRTQHDALVGEMVAAIIAAQKKTEIFKEFHTTLNDAGILTRSLPDVQPYFLEACDKYGRLASWLHEMCKLGIVNRRDIPAKLDFTR